jgi:hypothetical protein
MILIRYCLLYCITVEPFNPIASTLPQTVLSERGYCDKYSNGTLLWPGKRFSIRCRTDSILRSPRIKAIIDPIMIPPIPPTAIPSRNMRLRITVIVDHLSSQGIVDLLLFSPDFIDDSDEIILALSCPDYHPNITMASQCFTLSPQNDHNPTSHSQKTMGQDQNFKLFLVFVLYQKYSSSMSGPTNGKM